MQPTIAFLCLGLSIALIQPNLQAETTPRVDITITGEGDGGKHFVVRAD
jgi:hypothetical protein